MRFVEGNPVHPGRLHHNGSHSAALEPIRHPVQIRREALETLHPFGIPVRSHRYMLRAVAHIDSGRIGVHHFQTGVIGLQPSRQFLFLFSIA